MILLYVEKSYKDSLKTNIKTFIDFYLQSSSFHYGLFNNVEIFWILDGLSNFTGADLKIVYFEIFPST